VRSNSSFGRFATRSAVLRWCSEDRLLFGAPSPRQTQAPARPSVRLRLRRAAAQSHAAARHGSVWPARVAPRYKLEIVFGLSCTATICGITAASYRQHSLSARTKTENSTSVTEKSHLLVICVPLTERCSGVIFRDANADARDFRPMAARAVEYTTLAGQRLVNCLSSAPQEDYLEGADKWAKRLEKFRFEVPTMVGSFIASAFG